MEFNIVPAADFWMKAQGPLYTFKTHGKWENMIKNPSPRFVSVPKRTQGVAPRTCEGTTLLMWSRLEECGLVEGSESQDLGNH